MHLVELFRALAALAEPPTTETAAIAIEVGLPHAPTREDHTDFFVLQQPPYASVYLGADGMVGGDARDRIAGYWRALGSTPPPEPDHLATLLAAYAELCDRDEAEGDEKRQAQVRTARDALLWEHILSWLPVFLIKARQSAPGPYGVWAEILMEALLEEARGSTIDPVLPMHFHDVPPLASPSAGESDAFLAALLAPARTGMILARHDFKKAAEAAGLGVPPGERRHMLRALFEQDAGQTVQWLADQAAAWARHHDELVDDLGVVAEFWRRQADATSALLRSA
jgi:TorA maturation chaperone TorD